MPRLHPCLLLSLICLALPVRTASGEWLEDDPARELGSARTLPMGYCSLSLLRASSVSTTGRMQFSTFLLRDLAGSPNLRYTWSVLQRGEYAVAVQLEGGAHTAFWHVTAFPPLEADTLIRPYGLLGGVGSLDVGPVTLTASLQVAWHGQGWALRFEEGAPQRKGYAQLSPGLTGVLQLGPRDVAMVELQGSIIGDHADTRTHPLGFPETGSSLSAGLWVGRSFERARILLGAVRLPEPMPGVTEGRWLPAMELRWTFFPQ